MWDSDGSGSDPESQAPGDTDTEPAAVAPAAEVAMANGAAGGDAHTAADATCQAPRDLQLEPFGLGGLLGLGFRQMQWLSAG